MIVLNFIVQASQCGQWAETQALNTSLNGISFELCD